jgi:sugar/nucleoside kinase (ribokinase family)
MKMLENRDDLDGAIKFGHKAGFLCITKFGAGPSVPYLREI